MKVQRPVPALTEKDTDAEPVATVRVTVLFGSAVPENVALRVRLFATGDRMTGLLVSTVKIRSVDRALVLPAASVAFAVIACAPSARSEVGVKLQEPEAPTVIVAAGVEESM